MAGATAHGTGRIAARTVLSGLRFPAAFTFTPGGKVLYGILASGDIYLFDPKTGSRHLFFHVPDVVSDGEQGLLGLALHPRWPAKPYLYAYATRNVTGIPHDQILRISTSGERGVSSRVIFTVTTRAKPFHNGGRILFGPDGMLYAVVGEANYPANAQRLGNAAGKVLRMTPAGRPARGNPFPRNRIWTYGNRNSFGFDFDPRTGRLWETENGPVCNDELNRIVRGRNYGWGPQGTCRRPPKPPLNTNQNGPHPMLPQRWYARTIAPTGAAFCHRCRLGAASAGRLFFGAYNTGEIRRVTLGPKRRSVVSQEVVYTHPRPVLSMEAGPNGALYFSDRQGIYRLILA